MKANIDAPNCILVQDVKDGATQDQITMGSESTQIPTEGAYLVFVLFEN